ncbi:hypothetical protein IT403_03185 [Candidatus Nomurabacteria bacterium]|nr:hypothetical protein [Candidatus Nomurabacteria bacterium]
MKRNEKLSTLETIEFDIIAQKVLEESYSKYRKEIERDFRRNLKIKAKHLLPKGSLVKTIKSIEFRAKADFKGDGFINTAYSVTLFSVKLPIVKLK